MESRRVRWQLLLCAVLPSAAVLKAQDVPPLPGPGLELPVDVDGDGATSYGDKYCFNYYLATGGSMRAVLRDATVTRGILDVSQFFLSLTPAESSDGGAIQALSLAGGALFRRGDANDDGVVNVSDPTYILNWNFQGGPPPLCFDAADANDDGQVSGQTTDAVYLLNWLYQGGPQPHAPGPFACGLDPTEDELQPCFSNQCGNSNCIDLSFHSVLSGATNDITTLEISSAARDRFEFADNQATYSYLFNRIGTDEPTSSKTVVLENYDVESATYAFLYLRVRSNGVTIDAATNLPENPSEVGAQGVPLADQPGSIAEVTVSMNATIQGILSALDASTATSGVGGNSTTRGGTVYFLSYRTATKCIQHAQYGLEYSYTSGSADNPPTTSTLLARYNQAGSAFNLWAELFASGAGAGYAASDGSGPAFFAGITVDGDAQFKSDVLDMLHDISPCYLYSYDSACHLLLQSIFPMQAFCECYCDHLAGTNLVCDLGLGSRKIKIKKSNWKSRFVRTGTNTATIYIKPGEKIRGGANCKEKVSVPNKISLAHEMAHAKHWSENNLKTTKNIDGKTPDEEILTVRAENQIRSECGMSSRECYGRNSVPNPNAKNLDETDRSGCNCD